MDKIKRFCNMPVTGLTVDQVKEYLTWETERLMEIERQNEFQEYSIILTLPKKVVYERLFHNAKRSSMDSVTASQVIGDSVNLKGCPLFNFFSNADCETKEHRIKLYGSPFGLTEVDSYFPDQLGLYNILGNVSEMTDESRVVFGGNYSNYASQILNTPFQEVSIPNSLVGFRYYVTLVPYKSSTTE